MKKTTTNIHPLLERMGRIARMERGTLCRMTGRRHYNHQTWLDGHNVVRYIPAEQVARLQEAIDGYRLFMELARKYSDQIIQRTRRQSQPPHATPKRLTRKR